MYIKSRKVNKNKRLSKKLKSKKSKKLIGGKVVDQFLHFNNMLNVCFDKKISVSKVIELFNKLKTTNGFKLFKSLKTGKLFTTGLQLYYKNCFRIIRYY